MKIVTIVFAKGGKTAQISVEGACGPECQELTRPIEEGLGIVTSNVPTEDMFRAVEVVSHEQ